jgi:hypothetical protein
MVVLDLRSTKMVKTVKAEMEIIPQELRKMAEAIKVDQVRGFPMSMDLLEQRVAVGRIHAMPEIQEIQKIDQNLTLKVLDQRNLVI